MQLSLASALLLLPVFALGGENRWLGADPKRATDWHAAANWSLGAVPSEKDGSSVIIPSGMVVVSQNAAVAGSLELVGGQLIVATERTLTVRGDLVFRGKKPAACLTPNGEVRLHGTITSEGSAQYQSPASGWVILVGAGDQVITPGGFLPPIRLQKPSGKVTLSGDLHCAGLHVAPGNTLDLSRGQRLSFGALEREWHFDPKDKLIVKTYIPFRSSRDLINQGTLVGKPSVPFTLYMNANDKVHAVSGVYEGPRKASGNPIAGNVSINAPDSRLVLKEGKLDLDGKPAPAADESLLDDERARITGLSVREVLPPKVETAGLSNVAPRAAFLRSSPSIGHGIWNIVDGSPSTAASFRTGVGRGGAYEFIFAKPVTVSAVRFLQGPLFAIRYTLRADTDNDGQYDTRLLSASGGAPNAWREHALAPTSLHRLEFRGIEGQRGWEQSYPQIHEFEIYADKASLERLAADAAKKPSIPDDAKWLSLGPEVTTQRPAARPEDRILKGVMVDLWMFNIHDERSLTFNHIRDYEPFQKLLAGAKDLGADTVTIFVEAVPMDFWPSRNFRSLTNQAYFKELAQQALRKAEKAPDTPKPGGLDLEERKPRRAEEREKPEIDPPVKKDILKEFCDAMHESGITV